MPLKSAINAFEQALKANNQNFITYNNLGNTHLYWARFPSVDMNAQALLLAAESAYQKGLMINPSSALLLFNYARVQAQLQEPEEALKLLKRAIAANAQFSKYLDDKSFDSIRTSESFLALAKNK